MKIASHRRRNIPPAIYNEDRLIEEPIPIVSLENQIELNIFGTNDGAHNMIIDEDNSSNASFEASGSRHANEAGAKISTDSNESLDATRNQLNETVNDSNELSQQDEITSLNDANRSLEADHIEHDNDNVQATLETLQYDDSSDNNELVDNIPFEMVDFCSGLTPNQVGENSENNDPLADSLIKVEQNSVILLQPCSSNHNELDDLLDKEITDEFDDDLTFYVNKKTGYAKPFKSHDGQMIKRENDALTGNMAFNTTVSSTLGSTIKKNTL